VSEKGEAETEEGGKQSGGRSRRERWCCSCGVRGARRNKNDGGGGEQLGAARRERGWTSESETRGAGRADGCRARRSPVHMWAEIWRNLVAVAERRARLVGAGCCWAGAGAGAGDSAVAVRWPGRDRESRDTVPCPRPCPAAAAGLDDLDAMANWRC
jgi:hypothetical protein